MKQDNSHGADPKETSSQRIPDGQIAPTDNEIRATVQIRLLRILGDAIVKAIRDDTGKM